MLLAFRLSGASDRPHAAGISFPHEAAIRINVPVLAFSVTIAMLTGILFGLWHSAAAFLSLAELVVMQSSDAKRLEVCAGEPLVR